MNRRPVLSVLAAACVAAATASEVTADDVSPSAGEWRSYCSAYLKAVDGSAEASDLDVTYCLGVTKGLLNGMRIGGQIGALSFARVSRSATRSTRTRSSSCSSSRTRRSCSACAARRPPARPTTCAPCSGTSSGILPT